MIPTWSVGASQLVFGLVLALCTVGLVLEIRRGDRGAAVAESNHVVMAVAMVLMALPATATLVPPLAGAALFGALAAIWVGRLFVLLIRGERVPSPIGRTDCVTSPVHLIVADVATMGTYAVASGGFLTDTTMTGTTMTGTSMPAGSMPGMTTTGTAITGTTPAAAVPTAFAVGAVALAVYLFAHAAMIGADLVTAARPAPVAAAAGAGPSALPIGRGTSGGTTTSARRASGLRIRQACQALMSLAMGWMLLDML